MKNKKRFIALSTAFIITTTSFLGILGTKPSPVYAKVTLHGIEDLVEEYSVSSNKPNPESFTILEVVPDLSKASLGYLVGGEEPIFEGKSIKDMPSREERLYRMASPFSPDNTIEPLKSLSENNALTWSEYLEPNPAEEDSKSMDIRGDFVRAVNGSGTDIGFYKENNYENAYAKKYVDPGYDSDPSMTDISFLHDGTVTETESLYRRTAAFRINENGGGYRIAIRKIDFDNEVVELPVQVEEDAAKKIKTYNWQYFTAKKVTDTDEFTVGKVIFVCAKDGSGDALSYYGQIKELTDGSGNKYKAMVMADGTSFPVDDLMEAEKPKHPIALFAMLSAPPLAASAGDEEATPTPTPTPTPSEGSDSEGVTPTPTPSPVEEVTPTPTPSEDSGSEGATPVSDEETTPTPTPTPTPEGESGESVLGAFRETEEYDYYIVEETNRAINGTYRISNVKDDYGPYSKEIGFTKVNGSDYTTTNTSKTKGPYFVKINDQDPYTFDETRSSKFNFVADYSMDIYHSFKYKGGFVNNEWFKQYVFDRDITKAGECENLRIDVVPVTIDKIGDYLDKANLIYFSGGRYSEDILKDTALEIINKVLNDDFPIMIERSLYYANLYDDSKTTDEEKKENVNLSLFALELMQNAPSVITGGQWDELIAAFNAENINEGTLKAYRDYSNYDSLSDADKSAMDELIKSRLSLLKTLNYPSKSKENDVTVEYYARKNVNDASYVKGTIFVNDDWNDEWKNEYDIIVGKELLEAKIVSGDFATKYSDTKLDINGYNGFKAIMDEFEAERPIIENYAKWEDFNSEVSKATAIRYILNANNSRYAMKSKLKILDLEPMDASVYTDEELYSNIYMNDFGGKIWNATGFRYDRDIMTKEWICENLAETFKDAENKSNLTIYPMGTKEFIAKNDDINSEYDLIYIGMDTALMNTDNNIDDSWNKMHTKDKVTIYNDEDLYGMVYGHLGDKLHYQFGKDSGDFHLAGNDITTDKLRELKDYVKAGYAMLLSDDFFTYDKNKKITGIDTTHVDSSSNMYKLIDFVYNTKNADNTSKYFGRNVYRRGALEATSTGYTTAREVFAGYVNLAKVEINVIKQPALYNNDPAVKNNDSNITNGIRVGDHMYLPRNADGSSALDFTVELKSDSAMDASATDYDCKLYIDMDSDGKYEKDEIIDGIVIDEGSENPGSDGKFHLRTGRTYSISRALPEEYVGFISWKLAFIRNNKQYEDSIDEASVRTSVIGYSAIRTTNEEKPVINVLQILPNPQVDERDSKGKPSKETPINTFNLNDDDMKDLYNQVEEFDVQVTQKTVTSFLIKYSDNSEKYKQWQYSYYDYLCKYDIVVLGFTDMYRFEQSRYTGSIGYYDRNGTQNWGHTKDEIYHDAMLAIREYALTGHSILFTHDLSAFENSENKDNVTENWGYYANHFLRDVQGMDRFGTMKTTLPASDLQYIFDQPSEKVLPEYKSKYDEPLLKGSDTNDTRGYADANTVRWSNGDKKYGINTREITTSYNINDDTVPKYNGMTETVSQINQGQITQYPFLITDDLNSTFEVSMTHSQYFQLNLDTDSTDDFGDDDVVVWYAISNKDKDPKINGSTTTLHEFYKANYNDARNNYYIFSKGNVLYTGSGHSSVSSMEEKKLFVNTLVASYKNGMHAPHVIYKENPWDMSATIINTYIPYDLILKKDEEKTGGWLDSDPESIGDSPTVTINFKTINNNFANSKNALNVQYYVKVESGGDIILNEINYKKVTPVKLQVNNNGEMDDVSDKYKLKNYKIYQATFLIEDLKMEETGVGPKENAEFYIQIGTEELSSGSIDQLLATESLPGNKLKISMARLFNLE